MTSDRQMLDQSVPEHDLAALHHDQASRLLVALGHGHLGAHQSVRLSQTLQVASNQSLFQRQTLFDSSIERFTRPLPAEKGLQKRQPSNVPTASTIQGDKDNGQAYPSLSHALPEWYEAQNPHCLACSVPLLIGINANFDPVRRGLVCAACGFGSPIGMPDKESKRKLRSIRARKSVRAKDQGHKPGQASKKIRIEPELPREDGILSSQQKKDRDATHKPEQVLKTKDTEGNQSNAASLDARMKQKKKDKKGSQTASVVPSIEMSVPIPSPQNPDHKNKTTQHVPKAPTLQSKEPKIPNNTSTQSQNSSSSSKPRDIKAKGNDKQALRNMLAANKKKKDDANKSSGSKSNSTSSSGLQSFLDSL